MKHFVVRVVYFYFLIIIFCLSCVSEGIIDEKNRIKNEEVQTGSIKLSDFPCSFEMNGKEITFVIDSMPKTRIIQKYGPYYLKCDYRKLFTNYKVSIRHAPGVASGTYLCDVYYFSKSVYIPNDAGGVTVLLPDPCGYTDYNTQEIGVNWAWQPGSNELVVYFYTMIVKYNSAGAAMGWLIPCAGEDVEIGYYYLRIVE
ncbi:hypothetical protein KSZ28_09275 [Bacteroides salyersiae]|uniref:hypothetical protein n=1 Tax=Bacteroides salyersiae TaxID=291644 RepID=UPI001C39078F|nr:hypothetical protein [Bacteroides salyersiae]MBV4203901.1 hypothetical protein [Bacteroides salyersiae]MCB6649048.1 hypothetical protein [Bacteroides salyersiae]MCS3058251.1 hypothetical protein [Bacteroides salyersiae]